MTMLKLLIVFAMVAASFIEDINTKDPEPSIVQRVWNMINSLIPQRSSGEKGSVRSPSRRSSVSSETPSMSSAKSRKSAKSSLARRSSPAVSPKTLFTSSHELQTNPQRKRRYSTSEIPNPLEIRLPDTAQPRPNTKRSRAVSISEGIPPQELPYVTLQYFTFEYFIAKGGYARLYFVTFKDGFKREYKYAMKMCHIPYARDYDRKMQPREEYKTGTLGRLIGELHILIAVSESEMIMDWVTQIAFAFRHKGFLLYVMEYEVGGEATDVLRAITPVTLYDQHRAPIQEFYIEVLRAKSLLSQLIMAANKLHLAGFVHGDFKWPNILVDGKGYIKLADFGYAIKLSNDPSKKEANDKLKEIDRYKISIMIRALRLIPDKHQPAKVMPEGYMAQQNHNKINVQLAVYNIEEKKNYPNSILDDVRGLDFFADVNWDQVAERKSSQFLVEKLELTKKFTFDPSAYDSGLLLGDNEALKDFYYVSPLHRYQFRKTPPPVDPAEVANESEIEPEKPPSFLRNLYNSIFNYS